MQNNDIAKILDVQEIQDRFFIDDSGNVRWAYSHKNRSKLQDKIAGHKTDNGYRRIGIYVDGTKYRVFAHRIAYVLHHGEHAPTDIEIDHIDRNPENNSKGNLRLVSRSENLHNRKPYGHSDYKGVCKHGNGYQACISENGKNRYLGRYRLPLQAALAYDIAARDLYGDNACTNFTIPANCNGIILRTFITG